MTSRHLLFPDGLLRRREGTWSPAARRRGLAAVLAAGLQFSQAGCAEPASRATPPPAPNENDERFTLVLRAMNTSQERKSIDIEIAVDSAVVVRDRLSSEGSKEISIPPSKTFPLELAPGKHTLRARSSEGGATLEREIEIRKKHWALLSYEIGPDKTPGFTWTVQDTPIYFE